MRTVTVGLIQLESELFQLEKNLKKAEERIREAARRGADIVCLPELFPTGYHLPQLSKRLYEVSEPIDGRTVTFMQMLAKELRLYIVCPLSMRTGEGEDLYNAAVMINDDGSVQGYYTKNHMFGDEGNFFKKNGKYPVFETRFGKVGIMICYDCNFPEPARLLTLAGAELILMPAAWRIQEEDIWNLMIASHACENTVFIGAANIHWEFPDLYLFGHSKLVNPRGHVLAEALDAAPDTVVHTINLDQVATLRESSMPWLRDRHPEEYGLMIR